MMKRPLARRHLLQAALAALCALHLSTDATAQGFPSHDIIESLARPGGIGRSGEATFPAMNGRDADFVRDLPAADLSTRQRSDLQRLIIQVDLPRIDLDVIFDFGSDRPTAQSMALVGLIAQAIQSPALSASRILIAGHTDGVGSATANQRLSERRAKAVRKILIERFQIEPGRLIAVGFGAERLKDFIDPASGINRRVEVVNLGRF